MIKQLHVISGLGTGGSEMALYRLLSRGIGHRDQVYVVSLLDAGSIGPLITGLGITVVPLNIDSIFKLPLAILQLLQVLRSFRPDLIQGWMYHGNLIASLAAALAPGAPALVFNIRQCLYDIKAEKSTTQYVIRCNRWLSSRVGVVVYNSTLARQQHEAFGFSCTHGEVIPNGFDVALFRPNTVRRRLARAGLDAATDELVIGHVGRLHPIKGHACFLRAAVSVLEQRQDVRFALLGRDVFPDHPLLEGIIPRGLMRYFVFLGERLDVGDWMQGMDIFCQSSQAEAFPNVLGEAMASGLPCVATAVGDAPSIVGETGILVPPQDPRALARGLLTMLDKSSNDRLALGRAAQARVARCFSLSNAVARYRDLYTRLVR
jgi:glycosyltransferase involved in cell wall biosynthesis